jgi:hypothetical protein
VQVSSFRLTGSSFQISPVERLLLLMEDDPFLERTGAQGFSPPRARFRSAAEVADWDRTHDRGIAERKLKELTTLGFLGQEDLLLLGKTGEGKDTPRRRAWPTAVRRRDPDNVLVSAVASPTAPCSDLSAVGRVPRSRVAGQGIATVVRGIVRGRYHPE